MEKGARPVRRKLAVVLVPLPLPLSLNLCLQVAAVHRTAIPGFQLHTFGWRLRSIAATLQSAPVHLLKAGSLEWP